MRFWFTPLILLLLSCTSNFPVSDWGPGNNPVAQKSASQQKPTQPIQKELVSTAKSLLGKDRLWVKNKAFTLDCSGLVLAIYHGSGIDLTQDYHLYSGNGVSRLYKSLESRGLLHTSPYPQPGELIFFDNTYDKNENGLWDDPLTHVAMVVSVDQEGQIGYIHHNYRKGIVIEKMNLTDPDDTQKNSPMRMAGQNIGKGWLSSHLTRKFGTPYKMNQ